MWVLCLDPQWRKPLKMEVRLVFGWVQTCCFRFEILFFSPIHWKFWIWWKIPIFVAASSQSRAKPVGWPSSGRVNNDTPSKGGCKWNAANGRYGSCGSLPCPAEWFPTWWINFTFISDVTSSFEQIVNSSSPESCWTYLKDLEGRGNPHTDVSLLNKLRNYYSTVFAKLPIRQYSKNSSYARILVRYAELKGWVFYKFGTFF